MSETISILAGEAVLLLKQLIAVPSFSKEEDQTAGLIGLFFAKKGIPHFRIGNNIYATNKYFDESKPAILLNSHHDTVKPNKAYTLDPFSPVEKDGKLYGLGSNDAGGPLVSLLAAFLFFYDRPGLKYNLVYAASAEEEISGKNGIELLLRTPSFNPPQRQWAFALVGEPTQMQMAVAEKGLLVIDCTATGIAGHAAREEGDNAIYKAVKDIEWFRSFRFPRVSDFLGPVKMSVTVIETENKAHNVVPSQCSFVADIRVNELYTFEEILDIIKSNVTCDIQPRSLRLRSSSIVLDHPIVKAGLEAGRTCYGSPTTSDKALIPFPALKIGPGDSARSHTADEYIYVDEIKEGIALYVRLLEKVL
ncbi:M20 family metallo-hydrolase [Agriterribacter sp.]|uniref:M20 family metallo-hydrolase n=1 Tax=Agriterribacter sp. TaxID=2821509 RepID=UPI002C3EDE2B|nr:M20 family metallo-hydrolase [Agriterribacter sp.]HRO46590.1 M20 family metallo-hydrolase [Agriterribacter sp.]HRQ18028.1 M20 family metallo-hydrolase [Agriterribacter sp.]